MKISRKLSFWTVGSLVIIGGLSLVVHSRIMLTSEAEGLRALGRTVGPVIEESLTHSMITRDAEVLDRTLRNLKNVDSIDRVLLVNTQGEVKACTDQAAVGAKLVRDGRESVYAQVGGHWSRNQAGEQVYRWVETVRNRPECHGCHGRESLQNGAIVIEFSSAAVAANIERHIAKESSLFLFSFFSGGVVLFLLSNRLVIGRLNSVVNRIGMFRPGETPAPLPVSGNDEIGSLERSFNELSETVGRSERELRKYTEELLSLAVSSNVVTAVPRTENIYDAVCNVAIRELGLTMAWIGSISKETHAVHAVAQSGFGEGYLESVNITWDDSTAGKGPTGMAIKTKTPQVMNDYEDPAFAPWKAAAKQRGYRSSMALPLLSTDGDVLGVLNLYSGETAFFTRKRIRLFVIFSNQVSAAIENRMLIDDVERRSREVVEQFKVISQAKQEWQLTFDSITDLISIHDKEFCVIRANKAFARYFGLTPQELMLKKCHELFHGSCTPIDSCPHRKSMNEERPVTEEVVDTRNGKILQVSTYPYHSVDGEFLGSVHIAKDITDMREKEMRLIMSERLAALGQMSSGIAHEINNPLASIAGCTEGLLAKVRKGTYNPGQFEEYLTIIQEEILRCKSITTGMLSFVRKTAYEKKEVSLGDVIDKTLEIIGFQGRLRDVEIVNEYGDDVPPINASEGELRQVLLALIMNALDAMADQGRLTVGTSSEGDSVKIRIADTGPGIPEENLKRIFDPFFTTKSERGGTGLGLSIVHRIVTNHGGAIDVLSGHGEGAEFIITLPKQ